MDAVMTTATEMQKEMEFADILFELQDLFDDHDIMTLLDDRVGETWCECDYRKLTNFMRDAMDITNEMRETEYYQDLVREFNEVNYE